MNKEVITASIIGFSLGLVAAVAIWVLPRIFPKNLPHASPKNQVAVSPAPSNSLGIELIDIKDGDIVKDKVFKLKGTTTASNLVTISTPTENQIVKPDPSGKFEIDLNLTSGGNQLEVTAFNSDGNQEVTKNLFIYYFAENI